ncbi:MAG: exodeoxyribonuclease VII large subunit [Alphaproteobacteria bacterium]|nr:MAG: exodeoxyribonuclease VII large subunit [Alphaproteobacteria bacterium]
MNTARANIHEYTVSELSGALKTAVEERFGHVRVRGELSGVKIHGRSGHLYGSLKDEKAVLDIVCWRGTVQRLAFKPEDGLEVVATGRLTTYAARSKYQLVIERLEPAGVGALMALLEERKKKLAAEGLFDAARKRPIPFLPEIIGVITSPTGAVIRDILHRLAERFPRRVLLWPVLVQGEGAAEQVAAAIRGFNEGAEAGRLPRPDVLIVARGGGSIEDLWPFNEEAVVRAVAASRIPVISAVGHETDTTLIDLAADRRAPTPTAAAEMAVPVRRELLERVAGLGLRLDRALWRHAERARERLRQLYRHLRRPQELLAVPRQRLDELDERLPRALRTLARARQLRLAELAARLSPRTLASQFARQVERVHHGGRGLAHALARRIERAREGLHARTSRLSAAALLRELARARTEESRLGEALARAMRERLRRRAERVAQAGRLLETMSHRAVLRRGFALVHGPDGRLITRAAACRPGLAVETEFLDGRVPMRVEDGTAGRPRRERRRTAGRSSTKSPSKDRSQPSLFQY